MASLVWLSFIAFILLMLALDLGVFHKKEHVIGTREALRWTALWVSLALTFNVAIYFLYEHNLFGIGQTVGHALSGRQAALQFATGYLLEESLSLDNVFVIALIFEYFAVPALYQHRVLFWGIVGVLVTRGALIAVGAVLIARFSWTIYLFGGFLIFSAIQMLRGKDERPDPDHNPVIRLARRLYPVAPGDHGNKFFVRIDGRLAMTKLFPVLLLVESTDVVFALDSIPAIFGVTQDPFLVFTSNVFAVLGLRSLYFALAGLIREFHYLKVSLVIVLMFVGVKMLISQLLHISAGVSFGIILGILGAGIGASVLKRRREERI